MSKNINRNLRNSFAKIKTFLSTVFITGHNYIMNLEKGIHNFYLNDDNKYCHFYNNINTKNTSEVIKSISEKFYNTETNEEYFAFYYANMYINRFEGGYFISICKERGDSYNNTMIEILFKNKEFIYMQEVTKYQGEVTEFEYIFDHPHLGHNAQYIKHCKNIVANYKNIALICNEKELDFGQVSEKFIDIEKATQSFYEYSAMGGDYRDKSYNHFFIVLKDGTIINTQNNMPQSVYEKSATRGTYCYENPIDEKVDYTLAEYIKHNNIVDIDYIAEYDYERDDNNNKLDRNLTVSKYKLK